VQNKQHQKKKKRRNKSKSSPRSSATNETPSDSSEFTHNEPNNNESKNPNSNTQQSEPTLPPEITHILSTTCHYSILGLPRSASQSEVLKAYRKKCVLTHPDKLPPASAWPEGVCRRSAFDKVAKAYDVLGCERKREMYDRFGHEGQDIENSGTNDFGGGFGNDIFRDLFGASSFGFFGDSFSGRRGNPSGANGNPFRRPPRNKDLRYNLEVTLEDLYKGTTKHVAIQQPNPLQPHFPLRKEVEVTLSPGMSSGNSVRISGVVDSIPNCAPADVVFLISERRHPVYSRRGGDLAMEVKISLAESIGGWRRKIRCLDGRELIIGPPKGRLIERSVTSASESDGVNNTAVEKEYIQLPSTIIQSGDVHVLKGKGMPQRHGHGQYGDLYIQFVVEMPGSADTGKVNSNNLTDEEKLELGRLLHKLEGIEDPTIIIESNSTEHGVNYLEPASASDFGRNTEEAIQDEHLQHEEDLHSNDLNDFFQRAFHGRGASSFGGFNNGGFHYFSSSGRGFGYGQQGGDDEHKVECNQM
jgi:DnaJ-class molecular chaperone